MIITIDTGGTKTLIASFSSNGHMGKSFKFPTPKEPKTYVAELKRVVREHYSGKKVDAIVIALPGIIRNGTAVWCQNLGWADFHAASLLRDLLPGVPVLIENDANLAGLAETRLLRTIPNCSLYVTVSTGIGTGVCTNGYIDPGMRYSEAGRALIEYGGKIHSWESFASGRAIVDAYHKFARDITSKRTWKKIADRISRGFLAVIPIIQPDVIIIGGSVGTYFDRYGDYLRDILIAHLPPHIPCPKIIQARHPEEAVVYGCYYYGKDFLALAKNKR
ncbi:MAG: ROK family protein [Candidatus Nanogingivalaceae bacterium]|nr:ROK family protein [Candidatus Nanogingivalaceae bacterium]